jgi:hypothetical protein
MLHRFTGRRAWVLERHAGGRPQSPAALPLEEREGHLQAHSGLLVVAHCPRQPSHRLFAQSQHEREQRGSRMCTRPAHAHTCVAASGAHSLARLPRAEYVLGAGGGADHATQTRGGSGLFFSGWVSHCSSFSGHAFALPLFLRAVLASLFCCLPSGLVCYKPSMRCRPHALMHGSHIV